MPVDRDKPRPGRPADVGVPAEVLDGDSSCPVVVGHVDELIASDLDVTADIRPPGGPRRRVQSQQAFNEELWAKVDREVEDRVEQLADQCRRLIAEELYKAAKSEAGRDLELHQRVTVLEQLQADDGLVAAVQRITLLEDERRQRDVAAAGLRRKIAVAVLGSLAAIAAALLAVGAARERVSNRLDQLERTQAEVRVQLWHHLLGGNP